MMRDEERKFWDGRGQRFYDHMHKNHEKMWAWIEKYITDNAIESMIEIGGGMGEACCLLPQDASYTNIEVNQTAIDFGMYRFPNARMIHADFMETNPDDFPYEHDLLLAAAVIEHAPCFQDFIAKCLRFRARRILITFFVKLSDAADDVIQFNEKTGLFRNKYSESRLRSWLDSLGLSYTITDIGTDHILEIRPYETGFQRRLNIVDSMKIECRADREQMRQLYAEISRRRCSSILEVGSYQGGSILLLADALLPGSRICLVDLCDRKHAVPKLEQAVDYLRQEGFVVTLIRGDSADYGVYNQASQHDEFDACFIDGCHKTAMVIHDYMWYRTLVRDNGLIAFHDVAQPRLVRRAWEHYLTPVWEKQGLVYRVIGAGEYDRTNRPWATGIGLLEWTLHNTGARSTCEDKLIDVMAGIDTGSIPH
jgi:predicted O-methyltransferase YrrM